MSPFRLVVLSLVLVASALPREACAQGLEQFSEDEAAARGGLLDEIRETLENAGEPLTEEQTRDLAAILEDTTAANTAQWLAVSDPTLRAEGRSVFTDAQYGALKRAQAGRALLENGVEGLRAEMAAEGAPSLTFDQETQIRSVHDAHAQALNDLLDANSGSRVSIEPLIREIEEQLLLAALKFLNPAQRTAFAGSLAATDFAALNSDLPDDPEELQEYLDNLRSPAGGVAGGGRGNGNFAGGGGGRGGTLDRDSIQEIRINENSFTAEQSNQSRGSTQVIQRGGAGRFRGRFQFNFADESLDARNAFADRRPPYQERNFSGNFGGPFIRDRLTLDFSAGRDFSEQGDNLSAATLSGFRRDAIVRPSQSKNFSVSAIAQLAGNHVLDGRMQTFRNDQENQNVGQETLPEAGLDRTRSNLGFSVQETAVLSSAFSNEVRFSTSRFENTSTPYTFAPHINVQGAFRGGGATSDSESVNRNMDFGQLLIYTGNRWAARTGVDANYRRQESESRSNFNGTFVFASLLDYCAAADPNFFGAGCQAELTNNPGVTPQPASRFTLSQGDPSLTTSQFEGATYIQTDWRTRPDLTLSFGLRYQWQTNLDDSNDLDPRFGFAYALGPDTVLRGGTGIFHQRLEQDRTTDLLRSDPSRQLTLTIPSPNYPDPFAEGGGELTGATSLRVHADDLAAPYTWNSEVSIETSFEQGLTLTGSYRFIRGVRLYRERNINAPLPDCLALMPGGLSSSEQNEFARTCRPDPGIGPIDQLESTGSSVDHRIRLGYRLPTSFLILNGSYEFSANYDDTSTPADSYDQDAEWARSGARHGINTTLNVRLPWNINANTILNWSSGSPYSIRTGKDDNFDSNNNDRPEGVSRNSEIGPGFFEVGLDLSKSVQLRSDRVLTEGGPIAGGGYYGQRTGLRMTLSAQVNNLLNTVNFQNPNGVLTSPFFGQPTQARNARSVQMSVRFDF